MRLRVISLLSVCLLLTGSVLEPVVGALRDGEVHHESTVIANAHRLIDPDGTHGHEDAAESDESAPDSRDHEHGSATDHCTHVHGAAIGSTSALSFYGVIGSLECAPVFITARGILPDLNHPPKV